MSSGMGGMDIRLPMGLMFVLIGGVIAVYGLMTNGDVMYDEHSLGININMWWGLVLTGFGALMLLLTWLAAQKKKES